MQTTPPELEAGMHIWVLVLIIIASLAAGGVGSLWLVQIFFQQRLKAAQKAAEKIIAEAQARHKEILIEAKEEALRIKSAAEAEIRERRQELQRLERRLSHREENLDRRQEALEKRESSLAAKEKEIDRLFSEAEDLKRKQLLELESISTMTREQAAEKLFQLVEKEVKEEAARKVKKWEAEVKAEAEFRAQKILAEAIQRCATEVVAETTTTVVPLPSDEMKGRLIGREGRNIRALEQATGVELIIDDTPEAVVLSSFDPIRREIARIALEKLIMDGRIHPARIEEMVERARAQVEVEIQRRGEEAVLRAGVRDIHPELIKLLGRLHYRTSYGQNVLAHSVEVAYLAGLLASELGANVHIARKAGLLHDIGKALDHHAEGPHALIGARVVEQWEKAPEVVAAIAQHHGETEITTVTGFIVAAADALSSARPGARREALEQYMKRIHELENLALSFPGVEKAFALQAGREIRVMVKPSEVDDLTAMRLARDIAQKIEETLQYPGQIKITVIRETRVVDYAK